MQTNTAHACDGICPASDGAVLALQRRQVEDVGDDLEVEQADEAEAGEQLDDEVADGERRAAGAAAAAEQPVTDSGRLSNQRIGWKQRPQREPGQSMLFS